MNTIHSNLIGPFSSDKNDAAAKTEQPILLKIWQMLMRHLWVVVGIISAALALGIVVTLVQTPSFTAKTRIEIRRSQDNVTNVEAVTPPDSDQDLEFYQTQYSLLEARSLAQRVARRLGLTRQQSFFDTFGVRLTDSAVSDGVSNLSRAAVEERERKATDVLLDHIGISPIRGSSLVDVRFSSPDPKLSEEVANSWAEEFIQANLDRRYASSQDARDFLIKRLAALRQKLEASERELVGYAANSGIVTLSSEQGPNGRTRTDRTLTISDIENLSTELASATADRVRAEARLQQGVDQAMLDNQTLGALRKERADAAADYAKMSAQFDPKYPPLQALKAQLGNLDASIADQEGRIRNSVQTAYQQAVQRELELRQKINSLRSKLVVEQRDSIQYNIYQREVDTNRQLYDGLLQRFKEIGVAGVGTNNISIVDRAELPRRPSSPSLPFNLLVALICACAAVGMVVVALEQIDQSLKDPADVEKLHLALLGVIPTNSGTDILEELKDRKSGVSEAYLAAQTNLSFLTENGVPKSFALTSTRPSEGKSTSALALAFMLARVGHRTVLVDADIRSPSINGFLGLSNTQGLSNYLAGHDLLADLIQETGDDNLAVIAAGPSPPNAAELLSTQRFPELIRKLENDYDVVVIDAPPVLGLADVPIIARTAVGMIYTIEANGVKMRGIEAALDRLRLTKAHIFGALVTKYAASDRAGYGYGYGYAYGYGYGDDDVEQPVR